MRKQMTIPGSRGPAAASRKLLLLLPAVLLGGGGCLLSARSPEAPSKTNQVPYQPPTTMSLVLTNVQATFSAKVVDNYTRSLDPNFGFVPDPADESESGELPSWWASWNKQEEVQAFTNILNQPSTVTINFSWGSANIATDPNNSNIQYYQDLPYVMTLYKAQKDTVFSGKADLYMVETNGLYSITKWVDKRDGSAHATLGLVRWKGSIQF